MNKKGAWAEVSLQNLSANISNLRSVIEPDVIFMAVVKANAYGHGACEIAKKAIESGAGYLGVARGPEAVTLRQSGIKTPILIFGGFDRSELPELLNYDLTFTIYRRSDADILADEAAKKGKNVKVHIKIDTGMGRLGFATGHIQKCIDSVAYVFAKENLIPEGLYSHFASSDEKDRTFAENQLEIFKSVQSALAEKGIKLKLNHMANSAGILEFPEAHFQMVRAGIAMYGLDPSSYVSSKRIEKKHGFSLIPVMEFKTRIIHIKAVEKNFPVSYGSTFQTVRKTRIATVSVGYADGLNRKLSSTGKMNINGKDVPIAGRVCMDLTMLDTGDQVAEKGDEVLIFGNGLKGGATANGIAELIGTINYEVVCSVSSRVKRIYLR